MTCSASIAHVQVQKKHLFTMIKQLWNQIQGMCLGHGAPVYLIEYCQLADWCMEKLQGHGTQHAAQIRCNAGTHAASTHHCL